jgi:predicted nucleic acid-binding protein
LTRLPPPARLSPAAAHRLLATNFPHSRFLSAEHAAALLAELPRYGIAGGSVYDALVGSTALRHGLTLVSRDRRALNTYRELGVTVEIIR